MKALGLLTPTRKPCRTAVAIGKDLGAPACGAVKSDRCRRAWTPSQTRYAAPTSLMTVKTTIDSATTTPSPSETAVMMTRRPRELPSTDASPTARP